MQTARWIHWKWLAPHFWADMAKQIADLDRFQATAKARKAEKRAAA
jgi:hypothetical protein